jgi:hypothetical protein
MKTIMPNFRKRISKMDKQTGLSKIAAFLVATSFTVVLALAIPHLAFADKEKDTLPSATMTPTEHKPAPLDTKNKKHHSVTGKHSDPSEMMKSGADTFMQGFELAHGKKDKTGIKMMLDGHKMMANCEGIWAKDGNEFSGSKKSIHEGHAMMMRGYSMIKNEKDASEGAKMIEEGYRKVTDGIKTLQTETNSTKAKDKM